MVVIDLSSYGSALAIVNQFCDDQDVKCFEVSPVGSAALVILATKEPMAAQVLKVEITSQWGQSVICMAVIEDAHVDLLKTYLSQTSVSTSQNILVLESPHISEAMAAADQLLKSSISLLDFRVVRTFPSNAILTATLNRLEALIDFSEKNKNFKSTLIPNMTPVLKNYFDIVQ